MKKNICYTAYLALFLVGIACQLKYLFHVQATISAFDISPLTKTAYVNISYLLLGTCLFLEGKLAALASRLVRAGGRLTLSLVLLYEIFKLPIFKSFSLFSDWSYVMAAASMTAAYLLISSLWELVSAGIKKES